MVVLYTIFTHNDYKKAIRIFSNRFYGSLSTVVGDEKLTSREDRIGPLFMYAQCDEDTFLKVDEVSKTEP